MAHPAQGAAIAMKMSAEKFFTAAAAKYAIEWHNGIQAGAANRQLGDVGKRQVTDTAVGGEKDRKQALSRGPECPLSSA